MDISQAISIGLSFLALASSLYLQMIQRRKERPNLRAWWGEEQIREKGAYGIHEDQNLSRQTFEAKMLFANLSVLPDAVLDAECKVKSKSGKWLPVAIVKRDYDSAGRAFNGFPLTLPPREVVDLVLMLGIDITEEERKRGWQTSLSNPLQFQMQVVGLGGKVHRSEFQASSPANADEQ